MFLINKFIVLKIALFETIARFNNSLLILTILTILILIEYFRYYFTLKKIFIIFLTHV